MFITYHVQYTMERPRCSPLPLGTTLGAAHLEVWSLRANPSVDGTNPKMYYNLKIWVSI